MKALLEEIEKQLDVLRAFEAEDALKAADDDLSLGRLSGVRSGMAALREVRAAAFKLLVEGAGRAEGPTEGALVVEVRESMK